MSIEALNIRKAYGNFEALRDVSISIASGELVALLGPSGSGKTTLLRVIAGLETPDSGQVLLNGEDATRDSAAQRGVGFVFQHYALFRHMSVFENVAFGLRVLPRKARPSRAEIRERASELLRLVQLESYAKMYPSQLSGGQRQRVALARALAVKPKVLLLDEPFGALDAKVRRDLRRWLRRLHDELHVTSVLVTHDQEEALEVADRVAILNGGAIEQVGAPQAIYDRPASPFVYHFLGNVNLFHGRVLSDLAAGPSGNGDGRSTESSVGYVRPHELEVTRERPQNEAAIGARVVEIYAAGPMARLELERLDDGGVVTAELSRQQFQRLELASGDLVYVKPLSLRLFDRSHHADGGLLGGDGI